MGQYYPAFKAYDIRGKVPDELNDEMAYRIGRAYAEEIGPKTVCIGRDIRLTGEAFLKELSRGLNESGVDVIDLGLVGTEMVYFATAFYGYDGGIMITASHNPSDYNGFKLVRGESRPISSDTGLAAIEERTYQGNFKKAAEPGATTKKDVYDDFVNHLLGVVDPKDMKPLRLLLDVGNGAAGRALEMLLTHLPTIEVTKRHFEPDGEFPNGVPNPILPEARAGAEEELRKGGYNFGVAWDGDYDRCFFLDGSGNFIEGYYIVGLLAKAILHDQPGQTIIYDPRLTWNTLDIVEGLGGTAQMCKSGHAFIKEMMREKKAVYGGEMSAHHYFKAHWYCDSGMLPFLLVSRLVSTSGRSLGDLVADMIAKYPCSGEKNTELPFEDPKVFRMVGQSILNAIEAKYGPGGTVDRTDGLSIEFEKWRFNLRTSNTEPVIRLNVESKGDAGLVAYETNTLLGMIHSIVKIIEG